MNVGLGMYKKEFKLAIERTQAFGLDFPEFAYSDDKLLTSEFLSSFSTLFTRCIGQPNVDELVCQCLLVHFLLQKPLSELVGATCVLTIGYIEDNNRLRFYQSEDDLFKMMKEGVKSSSLNIHAWLTLPSMEIIDVSFLTSYAVINNITEGLGAVIAQHPDNMSDGLKYHPMLIGDEFLRKSGALIEF